MARTWAIDYGATTYEQALAGGAMPYITSMLGAGIDVDRIITLVQSSYSQLPSYDVAALVELATARRLQGSLYESYGYTGIRLFAVPLNATLKANTVVLSIRVSREGATGQTTNDWYCQCESSGRVPSPSEVESCIELCKEHLEDKYPSRDPAAVTWSAAITAIERGRFFGR